MFIMPPLAGVASAWAAAKSVTAGRASYSTRTSRAAACAASSVSATTTATGWPFQWTSSVPR
jgi:hypothetical protein